MRRWVIVAALVLAACGGQASSSPDAGLSQADTAQTDLANADTAAADAPSTDAPAGSDASPAETTDAPPLPPPKGLIVHEWATFTVFHAATATAHVPGVQRHEETVPGFVHVRPATPLPEPVLAKIQTAGAYFQAQTAGDVQVTLTLPQAVPVADFPPAETLEPPLGSLPTLTQGKAAWRLRIEPGGTAKLPVQPDGSLWAALRQASQADVTAVGQAATERFLFHRAIGKFSPPLRVKATPDPGGQGYTVDVHNDGADDVPHAWLLNLHAGGGLLQPLYGGLPAKQQVVQGHSPKETPQQYFAKVQQVLGDALVQQGLTTAEASALVATFTHNWLKTPGLRLVVVAPQAWANQWLPVQITPQPQSHVRVLLGRVELLTEAAEQALLQQVTAAAAKEDLEVIKDLGFFAEPKARRALQASNDANVKAFCDELIAKAAALP